MPTCLLSLFRPCFLLFLNSSLPVPCVHPLGVALDEDWFICRNIFLAPCISLGLAIDLFARPPQPLFVTVFAWMMAIVWLCLLWRKKNTSAFTLVFLSPSSPPTIFIASGYRGSMRTPLLVATLSTSSFSAARLISFPFRSATQSRKSNSTQHCCSFLQKRSCNSATGASTEEQKYANEKVREENQPNLKVLKDFRGRWSTPRCVCVCVCVTIFLWRTHWFTPPHVMYWSAVTHHRPPEACVVSLSHYLSDPLYRPVHLHEDRKPAAGRQIKTQHLWKFHFFCGCGKSGRCLVEHWTEAQ